jgi:hypothetical protein
MQNTPGMGQQVAGDHHRDRGDLVNPSSGLDHYKGRMSRDHTAITNPEHPGTAASSGSGPSGRRKKKTKGSKHV